MRLLVLLAALLLLAFGASAHSVTTTEDGKLRVVVGNLNEPSTTWMKTGLDVRISNVETGDSIDGASGNMIAVLISPSGETLSQELKGQHGVPGGYTFANPYYLTEAGQYTLELTGIIDGTSVNGTYNVAGPVPEWSGNLFPSVGVSDPDELSQNYAALKSDYDALLVRVQALESAGEESEDTPGIGLLVGLGAVAIIAIATRRL